MRVQPFITRLPIFSAAFFISACITNPSSNSCQISKDGLEFLKAEFEAVTQSSESDFYSNSPQNLSHSDLRKLSITTAYVAGFYGDFMFVWDIEVSEICSLTSEVKDQYLDIPADKVEAEKITLLNQSWIADGMAVKFDSDVPWMAYFTPPNPLRTHLQMID